jgi:mono/diheme cytochrome c family protein
LARRVAYLLLVLAATPAGAADATLAYGEYLYRVGGCENCHTDRDASGPVLAGGRKLVTPHGTFLTPNITPDRETGIGAWSAADFVRALRDGRSPAGAHYYPAFPYTSYTLLTDQDMHALYAYLMTRPAVRRVNEPHQLPWYARSRAALRGWKWIYFRRGPFQANPDRTGVWNRGAYLVRAAAHCSECHTPREPLGGPAILTRYLAGTADGPDGSAVPNITPDAQTGIGSWTRQELTEYLRSGMEPDGDFAGGLMAEYIDHGFKHLTVEDRDAVAEYVLSMPPIAHQVEESDAEERGEFD